MKRLFTLIALTLSCGLWAYKEPADISRTKILYHQGFYVEAMESFSNIYLKYDGSSPSLDALDAFIGRMACYAVLDMDEEYFNNLEMILDLMVSEVVENHPDFMEMLDGSLYREAIWVPHYRCEDQHQ